MRTALPGLSAVAGSHFSVLRNLLLYQELRHAQKAQLNRFEVSMNRENNIFVLTNEAIYVIIVALLLGAITLAAIHKGSIKKFKLRDAEIEFVPQQAEQPHRLPYR
jgi:hypothetical protein